MLNALREFLKVFSERKKRENGVLEVEEWVQMKLLGSVNSSTDYTKNQVLKTAYSNSILNFPSIRGQLMPEWQLMTMGSACSGMGGNLLRNIQYECQRGNKAILPLKRTGPNSSGYMMKVYRSNETICKNCPLRKSCIGEKTKFKKSITVFSNLTMIRCMKSWKQCTLNEFLKREVPQLSA